MTSTMHRRSLLALALLPLAPAGWAAGKHLQMEVWKDPNCGCCKDWVTHLEKSGFTVQVHASGNEAARARLGIPAGLGSCHTGSIEGYAIEGHVPAQDILKLLRDKPKAVGLAVPGMPVGAPGMDGPAYNGRQDPYSVLLVLQNGKSEVFHAYN